MFWWRWRRNRGRCEYLAASVGIRCPPLDEATQLRRGRYYSALQIFVEKIEGTLPGQFGGGLVITGRRIVVETMIRALINIGGVRHVVGLESLLPGRKSAGNARVK